MNNEPVAYVDNVWINRLDLARELGIGQMFSRCQLSDHQIPLYTHPVKELFKGESFERTASGNYVLVPSDKLAEMQAEIEVYKEALEKLARLGNGDNYGNSIGNDIAIEALRKAGEK